MKHICTFKVYPGRRTPKEYKHDHKRYFEVFVFPTLRDMHKGAKLLAGECSHPSAKNVDTFAAMVMPLEVVSFHKGNKKRSLTLGHAVFHRQRIGGGVVAHESLHMAIEFLRRKYGQFDLHPSEVDDSEEELAYVLTTIVRQMHIALFKYGVY